MLPSHNVPLGESWLARELQSLRDSLQTLAAAVVGIAAIREQTAFLAGQISIASVDASTFWTTDVNTNYVGTSDLIKIDYDPAVDAAVTLVTGSTGLVAVQVGGYQTVSATNGMGWSAIWADADTLEDETNILKTYADVYVSGTNSERDASPRPWRVFPLAPDSLVTIRARRAWRVNGLGSAGTVTHRYRRMSIAAIKLGM